MLRTIVNLTETEPEHTRDGTGSLAHPASETIRL